jgi:alkaline phosphatase D
MLAPLVLGTIGINDDQWDGYPQERLRLFNHILNNNINNVVVLTGDIHTSWANELKLPSLSSAGVEFVTTSVTTTNADIIGIPLNPAALFPAVQWANLTEHGYIVVDITKDRTQCDWFFVNTIDEVNPSASRGASWFVNKGERTLTEAQSGASGLTGQAPLAPWTVNNAVGMSDNKSIVLIIGCYPNPFADKFIVQFYLQKPAEANLEIADLNGRVMLQRDLGARDRGVNYAEIAAPGLPQGNYLLSLQSGFSKFQKFLIKID